jgi:hypothetical protein
MRLSFAPVVNPWTVGVQRSDPKLTEHFSLEEFVRNGHGLPNEPPADLLIALAAVGSHDALRQVPTPS